MSDLKLLNDKFKFLLSTLEKEKQERLTKELLILEQETDKMIEEILKCQAAIANRKDNT
jgi:hypothetical protein